MKKTRKQVEREYDKLYDKVAKLISKTNPCEVTIKNKTATCMACFKRCGGEIIQPNELCCDGCAHHNIKKGCQAEKPLMCKLWLCRHSQEKYPEVTKKLSNFRREAYKLFGVLCIRGDKTETISHIFNMDSKALYRGVNWIPRLTILKCLVNLFYERNSITKETRKESV